MRWSTVGVIASVSVALGAACSSSDNGGKAADAGTDSGIHDAGNANSCSLMSPGTCGKGKACCVDLASALGGLLGGGGGGLGGLAGGINGSCVTAGNCSGTAPI